MREFYSFKSFATLGGASFALFMILGTISSVFQWAYPESLALLLAVLFGLAIGWSTIRDTPDEQREPLGMLLFVWVLNGFLIYSSGVGQSSKYASLQGGDRIESASIESHTQEIASTAGALSETAQDPVTRQLAESLVNESAQLEGCLESQEAETCVQRYDVQPIVEALESRSTDPRVSVLREQAALIGTEARETPTVTGFRRLAQPRAP